MGTLFDEEFIAEPATFPNGAEGALSTLQFLSKELDELNRERWKANEATIRSWNEKKFYVPINQKKTRLLYGLIPKRSKKEKYVFRTEDLAQCAFSMLWRGLQYAKTNRVPLLIDY
ncbi:MAG: hypothetical protein ACI4B5_05620 [Bacteroidaceae bacterium]